MIQALSDALAERGYDTLTDVQQAVSDPELVGSDLLVSAQTGSGKTVGFGLAIAPTVMGDADLLPRAEAPLALIVAPTRELALQVMRELQWLYAKAGARVVSCVGGMDARQERRALERGAHIVVGTPGRLCDHINRGALEMDALRAVVLDEADEMLDLGFREDLEFMLGEAPEDRRTLLFSATVPKTISEMAKRFQTDAVRINTVSKSQQHADITYQAMRVAQHDAENAIINVLRYHDAENAIVFANTRAMVARLTARFSNRGFPVVSLSGELSQNERTHALQAMRDGRARVCVATDVAARGIDLPKLDLVVHAELPTNTEALLHRSGRTGRAGRKGISALIVPERATKKAERLLKWAKLKAEWVAPPSAEEILQKDQERLMEDPLWTDPLSDEESAFAAKLLETHSPEAIAAACLRLHVARASSPEELSAPDAAPERKERKAFGPSKWFSLSVGQNDRAEPRWILPLLCRAGNLSKDSIGAIRVQQSETFVELTEDAVDGFVASLGDGAELDEGIIAKQLDGVPKIAPRGKPAAPEKSAWAFDRPEKAPRKSHERKPYKSDDRKPRKPEERKPTPLEDGSVTHYKKKPGKPSQSGGYKGKGDKPKGKPYGKSEGKPYGKSDGKPGGKPSGKYSGKPGGKPAGKPGGKPQGKPKSQSGGPKGAANPSKRFNPPGRTQANRGGDARPRRSGK
ncbi:DEAD/DEAH box helicase [Actibacterium atlanticum]|uniref:DEAD/DEAH box helicase n=1 Tax=Actibacterium atlanticum TaxID=1461693 RepID=A0A058ZHW8_9RHOB|nr:DEAD/DEAH box helicase [Actibacterium atlanticum]KCV80782.1 DEAD/DEAH box helicase [Actibacterium atlanticum]